MDWLIENKDWVFSGVGVMAITAIGGILFKKKNSGKQQSIQSGDNSTNIQGGNNVRVEIGGKKDDE